jgi:hypothetical protein
MPLCASGWSCWPRRCRCCKHAWPRTAATARSHRPATGSSARPRVCARRVAGSPAGNWGTAARRCAWWRCPTRWWSIVRRRVAPAGRHWTTRPWWCANGDKCMSCPPVRLRFTEHQALHMRCSACGEVSAETFPAEVPSRAQYGPRVRALAVSLVQAQFVPLGRTQQLLADLFGARLGRGTVVSWTQQAARALEPVETAITTALHRAPVLHNDETGVRRGQWRCRAGGAPRLTRARSWSAATRLPPDRIRRTGGPSPGKASDGSCPVSR